MRKLVLIGAIAVFVWARAAHAAAPPVTVQAAPASGAAPLTVTFTASGEAVSYHWQFGDGTEAEGTLVQHTYETPGRFTAVVTGTMFGGNTSQASVEVKAYGLSLRARSPVRFGRLASFRGKLVPAEARVRIELTRNGARVASARTNRRGEFRIRARVRAPGSFQASFRDAVSNERAVRIRPLLSARFTGASLVGSPLALLARVRPAGAGPIHLVVRRGRTKVFDGRAPGSALRLKTPAPAVYRALLRVPASAGYAPVALRLRTSVAMPVLSYGSRGTSVRFLEERLSELRYALERVDGYYGQDTYDAVMAFQKVHSLERTGRVDGRLWRRLLAAGTPTPRYRFGTHLEVDIGRQVLFDVRGGKVYRVVQVSTGATGNTPTGTFRVYLLQPGFNHKLMYYSMYFLGNFAVHGYPSVPPYPASHGCVRVPLWIAVSLYDAYGYGATVRLYY